MLQRYIEFFPLFIKGIWLMRWWLFPLTLLLLLWCLYEKVEEKWDKRHSSNIKRKKSAK